VADAAIRSTGGAVLEQLHETDDGVERRAEFMRDVREEFALCGVGARDFAVESLELGRSVGDADGLPPFADEAIAEQGDGEEAEGPQRHAKGLEHRFMRDDEGPHERVGNLDAD